MGILDSFRGIMIELSNPRGRQLNAMGMELAQLGRYSDAEKLFMLAIAVSPKLPLPKINLCNIYNEQGRIKESEEILKEVLELPLYNLVKKDALYTLGNCYYYQQKFWKAIDTYESASKLRKYRSADVHYMMGQCYKTIGEWEKAMDEYQIAKEILNFIPQKNQEFDVDNAIYELNYKSQHSSRIDDFKLDILSPAKISTGNLNKKNIKKISRKIDFRKPIIFFVGAGISRPEPTNLPLAGEILQSIFKVMFELDKKEICRIFKKSPETNCKDIFSKLQLDLISKSSNTKQIGFEASFKALKETVGYQVIRFVDILKTGYPNLNHFILAQAIKNGHLVITTNFDEHIEKAYKELYKDKSLKVIVDDLDFIKDIENNQIFEGKLVKLHGTASDYHSIILSLDDVVRSTDKFINFPPNIRKLISKNGLNIIYPQTTLSIPKTLFLQKVLKSSQMIFMGYSGSDIFDINPIIESKENVWMGLMVEHNVTQENTKYIPPNRMRLFVDTSKLMKYLIYKMKLDTNEIHEKQSDKDKWLEAFQEWIKCLALKEGDGLHWLGKLYSQRGKFKHANEFYSLAVEKYKNKYPDKWIFSRINQAFTTTINQGITDKDIYKEIQTYIEENYLKQKYKSDYSIVLLNQVAISLSNEDLKEYERLMMMVYIGLEYAIKSKNVYLIAFAHELEGDLFFYKKKYAFALEKYQIAYKISEKNTGDIISLISILLSLARCYSALNQENIAINILKRAMILAKKFGNDALEYEILIAHQRDLRWRSILHLDLRKNVVGRNDEFKSDTKELDQCIINHLKKQSKMTKKKFEQCLQKLRKKYAGTEVCSYLNLVRSSISLQNLHNDIINNALADSSDDVKSEIEELVLNLSEENYNNSLKKIDNFLTKYKNPNMQIYLLFLKSNIYMRKNDRQNEVMILNRLMKFQKDNPLFEHNLGVAYLYLEKYLLAEKHLKKAIQLLDGYYPLAINNLFALYTKIKKIESANQQKIKLKELGIPDEWFEFNDDLI